MRLIWAALFVAATLACGAPTPTSQLSTPSREPLHITIVYPDTAEPIQAQDVTELGLRDLGMGRGDYALVRDPWMPSALTEALFMMIPEQEAMLASPEGRMRYARGVAKGIEDFLRQMAQ